jgi:hypothetical protein
VVLGGHRVVFNERARAFDRAADDADAEARRKIRTLAGNYQILALAPQLLLPWRNPVWLQYLSHKLGRLVVPYALRAIFVASLVLTGRPASLVSVYGAALAGQVLLFLLAGVGAVLELAARRREARPWSTRRSSAAAPNTRSGRWRDASGLEGRARRVHVRDDELCRGRGLCRRPRPADLAMMVVEACHGTPDVQRRIVARRRSWSPGAPVPSERRGRRRRRGRAAASARRARKYDWDYLWMLAFTALLFFRPQDQIPLVGALHLSELTAIGGLAAMAVRRIGAGKSITHVNAELVGILVLGAILLLTMPFSIWPGGSMAVFTDIYVKIILIFVLMVNTITSPRRVRQMTWIMITASGYLASRAVYDYLRGVNLTEGDRVRGAVGGMFENPNDLALNLVTFLAPTLFIIFLDKKPSRRLGASALRRRAGSDRLRSRAAISSASSAWAPSSSTTWPR